MTRCSRDASTQATPRRAEQHQPRMRTKAIARVRTSSRSEETKTVPMTSRSSRIGRVTCSDAAA